MVILPKKEGAYPKRDIDSSRLQKHHWSTTKVRYRLQSVLTDYKSWTYTTKFTNGLQKSDLDYKVY